MMGSRRCRVGVSFGPESDLYSFPYGHPMNSSRTEIFADSLGLRGRPSERTDSDRKISIVGPVAAQEGDLLLFHTRSYVDFVRESSRLGTGLLDSGDTPSFKGVYEASLYTVGSTLRGIEYLLKGEFDHFFNPIGGLHHARRDRAGGFCVFNDAAIAICELLTRRQMKRVAYVDIDAHHGDGVFYAFESDPRVIIGDIHEDGRYLYPGTGSASERGTKGAEGTKMNIPLPPGATDNEFIRAFDRIDDFVRGFEPEFILFQCGADGLGGDPVTDLRYTGAAHTHAAKKLHELAHEVCAGRILAMGGGGYNPLNVAEAWTAVISEFSGKKIRAIRPDALGPWW